MSRLAALGLATHEEITHHLPPKSYMAECPGCGTIASYIGAAGCVEDWDGETFRFKCCGHRAHLAWREGETGGARNWVEDAS